MGNVQFLGSLQKITLRRSLVFQKSLVGSSKKLCFERKPFSECIRTPNEATSTASVLQKSKQDTFAIPLKYAMANQSIHLTFLLMRKGYFMNFLIWWLYFVEMLAIKASYVVRDWLRVFLIEVNTIRLLHTSDSFNHLPHGIYHYQEQLKTISDFIVRVVCRSP